MSILYWLESVRTTFATALLSAATYAGSEWIIIAAAIAVYWCVSKKHGYYLMAVGFIGTLANQFIKILCRVPRPWVRDPDFTIVESARADATGYSFPSGHTQNATGILGGIARFAKRKAVRAVCIALFLIVGFSRMYLGVHYPADVLVGLGCGLVLVFALYPLFEKSDEKPQIITAVFAVTAVLSLAAALYVEHRAWPEDIDAENLAESIKTLYMMFGCSAAVLIGAAVERKKIRFDTKAPVWAQILKVALGLVCVVALRMALKPLLALVFGGLGIAHAVRYGLMVLFAILVWPLTFPWFARGCPLSRGAKKALKILLIFLLVLVLLAGALLFYVTRDTKDAPVASDGAENPFITPLGVTMLSGHRAGGGLAPENTMRAIRNCVESDAYELDMFEFDFHLTADGVPVLLHDGTLDRTSDAAEVFGTENAVVGDYTYEELRRLNMGAKFVTDSGDRPFAALSGDDVPDDLRITSLADVLAYLESCGEYGYIIEIKDGGEKGFEAADRLYELLNEYGCLDRAIAGTFHNEVTAYMDSRYPDMLRSAGVKEVLGFYHNRQSTTSIGAAAPHGRG